MMMTVHATSDRTMTLTTILTSLLVATSILPASVCAEAVRPNILFLIADDLGWADVGWHGSEIDTPHLDGLARDGVILDQHYVTPMCSSTRACLLSGRYSTRFGLDGATNSRVFPFGMITLASALQSLGYETGLTGKWHLGSTPEWGPQHFGFTRSYGSFAGGVDQYLHLYKRGPFQKTWQRNHQYVEEEGHATDLIAREAVRWIEAAPARGRPWYIQVAFTAVHVPIQEPDKWIEPYADRIENESRRRFAACATHMDHAVGEMIAALEETEQKRNTLIVFTSDNGGSGPWKPSGLYPGQYKACPVLGINKPLRGRKGTVFEGGIRVPAFVCWPGKLPRGATLQHPVHAVDWMPTLLRLTGYEMNVDQFKFDGHDIWPLLTGEQTEVEPRTLYFSRGNSAALRGGNWKIVISGVNRLLFNLADDPNEENDLAGSYPEKLTELVGLLQAEREKEKGAGLTKPKP
jgi:arylsulfatase A-like enzyme